MSKKSEYDIDQDEQDILKDLEQGDFVSVSNLENELATAKEAAKNYVKRDSRVNLRISSADLNMLRNMALQEGIPYQTLMASVIHKFVSGRLVDVKAFIKKVDKAS